MRPAILAPLPSLLCLELGLVHATNARRVTLSSRGAVVSPEPAMPWPCATMLVANPGSRNNSID